jgi:hypothetical protein
VPPKTHQRPAYKKTPPAKRLLVGANMGHQVREPLADMGHQVREPLVTVNRTAGKAVQLQPTTCALYPPPSTLHPPPFFPRLSPTCAGSRRRRAASAASAKSAQQQHHWQRRPLPRPSALAPAICSVYSASATSTAADAAALQRLVCQSTLQYPLTPRYPSRRYGVLAAIAFQPLAVDGCSFHDARFFEVLFRHFLFCPPFLLISYTLLPPLQCSLL